MPPKSHRKPLTPLQRKQQKKKYELIHKAQVKSQYYKTKKDDDTETPDYVKEIFGTERTIDKNGNVVELELPAASQDDPEPEFDLDQPSSSEEENDTDDTPTRKKQKTAATLESTKHVKPNPFKSQLEEHEKRLKESKEEKETRQKQFKEQKQGRNDYYKQRNEQRSKMLARTKRGQPKMAAQMDVLLQKIQKNLD